ncbi:MAG: ATP-binding protein [Pseudomonadota bacterium]
MTIGKRIRNIDQKSDSVAKLNRLRQGQIRQIYSHSLGGGLAALLGGVVFAGTLWGTIPEARLIAWISVYVTIFVVRIFLILAFQREIPAGEELFIWGKRHILVTTLSGLVWTAAAVFIFPENVEYLQIFMIIFVGGIVAGAVVVYSATNEYLINILLVLVPLSARFMYQGGGHDPIIGVILFMFGGFMALLGHNIHELYSELLTLRFEKDDLIESLKADIASQERAAEVTTQLRAQAEAASAAKSEFLMNMNHELRTPLTAITGFADLLSEQFFGKLNEKQLGYVNEISQAGRLLSQLINDILDLSKVDSGKMELSVSSFRLSQLLENCLNMVRQKAVKRGLKLKLSIQGGLEATEVLADEIKLKQILVNLLYNATKFTPPGGHIELAVERKNDDLIMRVSDTGIGLKPEDQERIFEPFERLDSSLSTPESGTGLGLALVKRLVELHGGRVRAASKGEGKGSSFSFTIPFLEKSKVSNDKDQQFRAQSIPPQKLIPDIPMDAKERPKVLVVEDNKTNMKLVVNLLEAGGYNALQAFSAGEGIRSSEIYNPVLIVMDITLPDMDGLAATRIIKSNPSTSHIPIIALTADMIKINEKIAEESGCDAYFEKPLDIWTFFRTLSALIESGNQFQIEQFAKDKKVNQ